ncbi:glutathione-specific gamma-glutamylcyclotransferase 1 [Achroia grisella]|uniref:glutathione-specific gamma-glutamylcyclotransferase 1 n=1 Tax=Achroia grisella TaxID=688607 RepID=UPI0027D32D19|nr:glutathione-specific gamma-glutamylcyclotransferase 1 [Achroia grisella]
MCDSVKAQNASVMENRVDLMKKPGEDLMKATSTDQNGNEQKVGKDPLWIFGYGSLCWNPGFEYLQAVNGYVDGFSRRFYQGNITHRGSESQPGRVATLVEDKEGITWGKAFLVAADNEAALPYLSTRECQLGGYKVVTVDFYPRLLSPSNNNYITGEKTEALMYIAVPGNKHWLGTAPLLNIADQILICRGPSGTNVEYLLRLVDFMRDEIPEALDDHLFSLERLVKKLAAEKKICLKSMMGVQKETSEVQTSTASFQFASRIPEKKLRCVNM